MDIRTLEQDGKIFALIPVQDYQNMLAELNLASDIAEYIKAKNINEEAFPITLYDEIDIGANPLKVFRQYRGMTQAELARQSGVPRPLITNIEAGRKNGSITTMKALAAVLNVYLDDLAN